jgi:hypothetical protein
MTIAAGKNQEVPMSVRMKRVLTAVKRMPFAERFQLLVKAGLMTEVEAQQILGRLPQNKKNRPRSRGPGVVSARKVRKPGNI